jgi:phospholipid/cholesterol/gamma-HCH transport system ATP-binding protein
VDEQTVVQDAPAASPEIKSSEGLAIEVKGLKKSFDGKEFVLKNVNLEIPKGKVTVLIGFSGGGKTVLLKLLLGLLFPTEGTIKILGKTISDQNTSSESNALRKRFGVLFQNAALFDDISVIDNVAFPLREHRRDLRDSERIKICQAKLRQVGIEAKDEQKLPSHLSGGMRKRVGLARALALDPEILFYDEPTTGLDPIMTEVVDELILSTQKSREGLTSIIVSHDLPAAFRIGDYIAMLHEGAILLHGTPDDFLTSEIEFVKRFVSKGVKRE